MCALKLGEARVKLRLSCDDAANLVLSELPVRNPARRHRLELIHGKATLAWLGVVGGAHRCPLAAMYSYTAATSAPPATMATPASLMAMGVRST